MNEAPLAGNYFGPANYAPNRSDISHEDISETPDGSQFVPIAA
ncbi:hypothetical protein AWB83_04944 [Caballeronia ptereochthonis]|uniref:Uncharacterized protein n=1 Tax=Caballeronia ptereochthonis TaxID=1777144 RepID=A0A158D3R4_9BURK|nr:hypothetical protein AWB83_04944 [Caballeronia ptereochthonis]